MQTVISAYKQPYNNYWLNLRGHQCNYDKGLKLLEWAENNNFDTDL